MLKGSEKKRITSNYLVKLGLLNTIREEPSEISMKNRSSDAGSHGSFSPYSESDEETHFGAMELISPLTSPNNEEGKKFGFSKTFDEKKYIENELETLLKVLNIYIYVYPLIYILMI